MAAGARRRFLPAWMGAAGEQRAAAAPPKGSGWRRQRQQAVAGSRAAAAVVYCMNEAELVDVALAVLSENLLWQEGEEKARSGSEEEPELQPTPDQAPGGTDSSERGSDRSPVLPSPPDAGAGAHTERTGWEDSEDDVLKYVREIFFS